MTTKFQKRLLKLANFLDKLPEEKFNFNTMCQKKEECGSATCALGWCPTVFPKLVKTQPFSVSLQLYSDRTMPAFPSSGNNGTQQQQQQQAAAAEFFGITYGECSNTFFSSETYGWLNMHLVKPGEVAQRLRSLAKQVK